MLELNFTPFPVIDTERLHLRRITDNDLNDLFYLRSNTTLMKYIDRPLAKTPEDAAILLGKMNHGIDNNEGIVWAITLINTNKLIGTISYHRIEKENYRAEIGYMLDPAFWRKGIVSEAMATIIEFGFDIMKLHSIEANINPGNAASANILKKFKFVKEAYYKENYYFDGRFLDTEIYSLLKEKRI